MNAQNRMTSISMEVAKMVLTTLAIATLMLGCSYATAVENPAQAAGPISSENYRGKPATEHTVRANAALEEFLPKGDFLDGSMMTDLNESTLVAPLPQVMGTNDLRKFEYLKGKRPDPMNPSLFHASRVAIEDAGLYRVAEGFYQIRGDIAHITAMRGETGWIILDPGTTKEFTEQAWAFAVQHLPGGAAVPIVAVFYSHSHIDHWGGVRGLVSREDVDSGRVKIIAPYGFMDETVAENIIAGNAMSRRSQYQFGITLPVLDDGTGFATLGGALQMSHGETTLIAPTLTLPEGPGEITKLEVDGVEIFFKDISGAEAPSAALLYVPKYKLIFNSELFARGLHNVYTLRGALVRDALRWSKYINEVLLEWGDEVEIMTGPHSPAFTGNAKIQEYLRLQRDNVGFIHNQSARLANKGVHIQDVGDAIDAMVPQVQREVWHTNGYHGTYNHNARGVVNRYLGFYDGNPANLSPLPTRAEAVKFVEYMGGADAILRKARTDFETGEYRWVATAVNKVVVADPDNWEARHLLADTLEQLGYQAEGPQWRHPYLAAAWELRVGQVMELGISTASPDVLLASRIEDLLDFLAVLLISEKAEGLSITMNIVLSDTQKVFFVELANANLNSARIESPRKADTTVTIAEIDLKLVLLGQTTIAQLEKVGRARVEGKRGNLQAIASRLDSFSPDFPLVPMPTK